MLEDFFGVRHLRNGVRRDEADSIDVFEAGRDQGQEIVDLEVSGDLAFEALPCITRTFDKIDFVRHFLTSLTSFPRIYADPAD